MYTREEKRLCVSRLREMNWGMRLRERKVETGTEGNQRNRERMAVKQREERPTKNPPRHRPRGRLCEVTSRCLSIGCSILAINSFAAEMYVKEISRPSVY